MAKTCQAVNCDSTSLRSCLAGLSTREASAEVGQLLRCRRVRAAMAMTGQTSGHHKDGCLTDRSWSGAFDRWQNLTGHIAYRIFDRLPVKYPVLFYWCFLIIHGCATGRLMYHLCRLSKFPNYRRPRIMPALGRHVFSSWFIGYGIFWAGLQWETICWGTPPISSPFPLLGSSPGPLIQLGDPGASSPSGVRGRAEPYLRAFLHPWDQTASRVTPSFVRPSIYLPSLPYLTSGVDRLLHLPSAEAVSARPNARPRT